MLLITFTAGGGAEPETSGILQAEVRPVGGRRHTQVSLRNPLLQRCIHTKLARQGGQLSFVFACLLLN